MTSWNGTIHPAADAFPMLDDDRLVALAESIKKGGLRNPGWLTPDGTLIDGRNRRKACEMAGVQMRWEVYAGDDIIDFIVHQNVDRRDLTAGQRAAIACDLMPLYQQEALKRMASAGRSSAPGRKAVGGQKSKKGSINVCYLSESGEASTRLSVNPDQLEKPVGKTAASVARVTQASRAGVENFKSLQVNAPDLAAKVRAGDMSLHAATKSSKQRAKKAAKEAEQAKLDVAFMQEQAEMARAEAAIREAESRRRVADQFLDDLVQRLQAINGLPLNKISTSTDNVLQTRLRRVWQETTSIIGHLLEGFNE